VDVERDGFVEPAVFPRLREALSTGSSVSAPPTFESSCKTSSSKKSKAVGLVRLTRSGEGGTASSRTGAGSTIARLERLA
jgi:hypothetical protein